MKKNRFRFFWLLIAALLLFSGCDVSTYTDQKSTASQETVPESATTPYVTVNDNVPYFSEDDLTTEAFEDYSELDALGRCQVAYANICKEIMPTEERGEIGMIRPSGWHTVKYDIIDGKYLYNRCHLIGYQLAGENANEKNLITGTRYLNVVGMLPFENMVADYVNETDNHVLYRVTPVFEGDNLVASGVRIEAESVEDKGEGIQFHVYCYNVQPGITIDYATGDSWLAEDSEDDDKTEVQSNAPSGQQNVTTDKDDSSVMVHVTDTGTKYHSAGCSYLSKSDHEITLEEAKEQGLKPCSKCNPPQ